MAKLQSGTRIYGNATIDTTLYVTNVILNGDTLVNGSTSNLVANLQDVSITSTSNMSGDAGFGSVDILVTNLAPILNTGIVITAGSTSPMYLKGAASPGGQTITFHTGIGGHSFTAYGFLTTPLGTVFSSSATGTSGLCLAKGTLIAMANGTYEKIENIDYQDDILVWNFDLGKFDENKPLWIKKAETASQYNLLTFSDGHVLRTVDQHRIFNKERQGFTYPMTSDTPIGTTSFNQFGEEITLVSKQVIYEPTEYYNVITYHHMNLFANSILTSCRFNNLYPIQDMKFVKDSSDYVELIGREEFNTIQDRFYYGLRLAEQKFDIPMIESYVARLVDKEKK